MSFSNRFTAYNNWERFPIPGNVGDKLVVTKYCHFYTNKHKTNQLHVYNPATGEHCGYVTRKDLLGGAESISQELFEKLPDDFSCTIVETGHTFKRSWHVEDEDGKKSMTCAEYRFVVVSLDCLDECGNVNYKPHEARFAISNFNVPEGYYPGENLFSLSSNYAVDNLNPSSVHVGDKIPMVKANGSYVARYIDELQVTVSNNEERLVDGTNPFVAEINKECYAEMPHLIEATVVSIDQITTQFCGERTRIAVSLSCFE